MSVNTLAGFAAARTATPHEVPMTQEASGESPAAPGMKATGEPPTTGALLAKLVPTEVLAVYTPLVGAISPFVTPERPLMFERWCAFALLVGGSVAWFLASYRLKAPTTKRFPLVELLGLLTAASALGFVMPQSPYYGIVDDPIRAAIGAAFVGAVGLLVNSIIALRMKMPSVIGPAPAPAVG
ncbi:hypothetical protein [Demequina maris]|uniref:hypothetical protein n=1 Tax=Demequina maris TaxID=1638982 RepID=UPI0007806C16|nr:hypothetical protein [Demequina maris]